MSDEPVVHWHGWCPRCTKERVTYSDALGIRCDICGTSLKSLRIHSASPGSEVDPAFD